MKPYSTPKEISTCEVEIKKSLFIGRLYPVSSEEEAAAILQEIRKTYKDATHHCFAMRIGIERIFEKSGDDGEPQGTAGHPMLHVLQAKELTNVLAIVTRYFGGIKLGAGGLTRAYSQTLAQAVEEGTIAHYVPYDQVQVTLPYTAIGAFENYSKDKEILVKDRTYAENIKITMLFPPEDRETHLTFLTDITAGKVEIETLEQEYIDIKR